MKIFEAAERKVNFEGQKVMSTSVAHMPGMSDVIGLSGDGVTSASRAVTREPDFLTLYASTSTSFDTLAPAQLTSYPAPSAPHSVPHPRVNDVSAFNPTPSSLPSAFPQFSSPSSQDFKLFQGISQIFR